MELPCLRQIQFDQTTELWLFLINFIIKIVFRF